MIPQTPQHIRDWMGRLGLSGPAAARALGLGNPDTVMRQYCSPDNDRAPALTTRMHMDLLEAVSDAANHLREGRPHRAQRRLEEALGARAMLEPDTTPGGSLD